MNKISNTNLPPINSEDDEVGLEDDEVDWEDNMESTICTEFDEVGDYYIEPVINTQSEIVEPIVGMKFSSVDDAYQFYVNYGGKFGFNVRRKHHTKKKNGVISRVVFCCSKEGFRQVDKRKESVSFTRPISRTGCKADIACLLGKDGKYKIVSFKGNHNHELVRTSKKHILKANTGISNAQKTSSDAQRLGFSIEANGELMSKEVGDKEHLGSKQKSRIGKGEAKVLLQYFQKRQMGNSSFFYALQLDEDDMITNIFWTDARSICDYRLFGDVICFDTTCRINEYARPFATFIGVNHHKQSVVFGAALLYDETIESFKWLFETFLGAMSEKQPKTILTDQSAAMAEAISNVFPETQHRLCIWHIFQNGVKCLSHVFDSSNQFVHDFSRCLYDYEDKDDWLLAWQQMLDFYNLNDNKWLTNVFELREKWVMVYGRHTFTTVMRSTRQSKSKDNLLKKYLKSSHDILHFLEQYEKVLADRRNEELIADFKMHQTTSVLLRNTEMLQHAAEVYTPVMFKLFQKEYIDILMCNIYKVGKFDATSEYKVSCFGRSHQWLVKYEALTQTVTCSCMKFTFMGILCTHALKVLEKKNVNRIPTSYILKRWTKEARATSGFENQIHEVSGDFKESIEKRYNHLCRMVCQITSLAAEHEKLFEYASQKFVQLLKDLEKMKKNILVENNHANSVENSSLVADNLSEARGVKRKSIVSSSPDGFNNPLENWRYEQDVKSNKVSSLSLSNQTMPLAQENITVKDRQTKFLVNQ